jgi:carbon monoxide dehydrogenase subunit G
MILAVLLACMSVVSEEFIVDAVAEREVSIAVPVEHLRQCVADVELLRRHMPGVVAIQAIEPQRYSYRTQRDMPLSGTVTTDFVIERMMPNDSTVIYRTPDKNASNYMSFSFALRRDGMRTVAQIRLRVRLTRADAREIHLLAPLLGADFISDRMEEDLRSMLDEFARRGAGECEETYVIAGNGVR